MLLGLPANGLRLRFDGSEQRLRLIEVLNFRTSRLTYKDNEIFKTTSQTATSNVSHPTGPTFRHVYHRLFGPTFPGEYVPPGPNEETQGSYVLSYPGIAFSFPFQASAWSPKTDFVSLLSSSAASPASSMAIFDGPSWPDARQQLFSGPSPNPRSPLLTGRAKDTGPDEVDLVKVHGGGQVEVVRRSGKPILISLNETTPQDLVAELGPPDAIYRKNDRRLSIHGGRNVRTAQTPGSKGATTGKAYVVDETEPSSSQTNTDDSDDDSHSSIQDFRSHASPEFFYNYFRYGFDVFISAPTDSSLPLPKIGQVDLASTSTQSRRRTSQGSSTDLTATKILLHGNIPGSYPFNRHRRIRWTLEETFSPQTGKSLDSETVFPEISRHIKQILKSTYRDEDEERQLQKGMVLNRGWGDSPGSSCELLGGWEESVGIKSKDMTRSGVGGTQVMGNTEIFGFPGMVFEVLRNHTVSCLTIF